ncbi:glycoside hydrolase family 108 protein [Pseudoroseicyclus aestuarii]|uniref:Lysozyme family protein n=1 Tax=Pseudoroseicyclus aestuarii TaxID=1795041 RepID=A0A318T3D6_9RHOB|nr:glycoside hydrolase family 108 protein [Pseudoroseicyclus aestuarii]PYE80801.1 lysozyme family protein [Pseudoroseicyclus aestuarii]
MTDLEFDRFDRALPLILAHEGGYVNDPADPGGATNKGITQNTYTAWLRMRDRPSRDVRAISDAEVAAIYREQYWNVVQADRLPVGLAYCVFDAAVNSGPARAARWLQEALGFKGREVDGVIGEVTLSAANASRSSEALIRGFCDRRMAFLRRLKHWPRFGRGWTRRVGEVRAQAVAWASIGEQAVIKPQRQAPANESAKGIGEERVTASITDALQNPAALTGAGSVLAGVATAAQGDGPVQFAFAAVLVIVAIGAMVYLLRRARA